MGEIIRCQDCLRFSEIIEKVRKLLFVSIRPEDYATPSGREALGLLNQALSKERPSNAF